MKYKLLYFFLVLCDISVAQYEWKAEKPFNQEINDIFFPDRKTGYAVYRAQYFGGGCNNTITMYKTIDAGKNWIPMNTGLTYPVNAVYFLDEFTGWIAGNIGEVRKTTDGGVTWTSINPGSNTFVFNDIWFTSVDTGFAVADNGVFRKTVNGGISWQWVTTGLTTSFKRIYFSSHNLGFVLVSNNSILRTINGGSTWTAVNIGIALTDIYFTSAAVGYAINYNKVYKTINGGLNWTLIHSNNNAGFLKISFPSENVGYIASSSGIFMTTNAGATWDLTPNMNGIQDSWLSMCFIDNNSGFVCGDLGKISRTTDGGKSWKNRVAGFDEPVYQVYAPHKDTSYFSVGNGKIFKTENGGINFFQLTPKQTGGTLSLYFLNGHVGFTQDSAGKILKTVDGGYTWVRKPVNPARKVNDFHFLNSDDGYAAADSGVLFTTHDGGETWDSIKTNLSEDYIRTWFINADTGFAMSYFHINRTYNGGVVWTPTVLANSGLLNDITFTNHRLGYCATDHGLYYTTNCGLNWYRTDTSTTNPHEIDEFCFVNDSVGYFPWDDDQGCTLDSGKTIIPQATQCGINLSGMEDISMTDGGNYGYAVGSYYGVINKKEANEITRCYTATNNICAGGKFSIAYHATGFYAQGNFYTAQLSDTAGDFSLPVNIGTFTPPLSALQSGIITATLPSNITPGNYRVRVVSSNPVVISPDNGIDLSIQPVFAPAVSIQLSGSTATCAQNTIALDATAMAGGQFPKFLWTINHIPIDCNSPGFRCDSLQTGDSVQVTMQSNLGCVSNNSAQSNVFVALIHANPTLYLSPDTSICVGSTIQLNAPQGYTYAWNPGTGLNNPMVGNPIAVINSSIQYQLEITDTNGCRAEDSIFIQAIPLPTMPSITFDGTKLISSTGYSYQWYFNGTAINGADSGVYTPAQSGSYEVKVVDSLGCEAVSTPYVLNLTLSESLLKDDQVSIFPNPAKDIVNIVFNNTIQKFNVIISDELGREVLKSTLNGNKNESVLQLPLLGLVRGLYFIKIKIAEKEYVTKLNVE